MKSIRLIKMADFLCALASDDLSDILNHLDQLDTYSDRKEYAEKHLEHLSSGSSRIVYRTDDGKIIKLAKNEKGIAQNRAEANPKMKSDFINPIIKHSKKYFWLMTHYLEKITEADFKKMTGLDFEDFGNSIRFGLKDVSDNSEKKPKDFSEVSKSKIYKEMIRLGTQFQLMPGDLARISSWGEKDNHPVLIDAGLTKQVYDDYYDDPESNSSA